MDFERITKIINRKLGFFEVVTVLDVKKLWVMAGVLLESTGVKLHEDAEIVFKKRWIQCRIKQMPEYWTDEVMDKFNDLGFKVLFSDLESTGKEDEERLMKNLIDEKT